MCLRIPMTGTGTLAVIFFLVVCSLYIYSQRSFQEVTEMKANSDVTSHVTLEKYEVDFTEMSMTERNQFVARRCREVKTWPTHRQPIEHKPVMLIDHSREFMACSNLKAASSSIANFMYTLANLTKITQKIYRTMVLKHQLSTKIVNTFPYQSFMFVRDPLERLLSAYRDNRGVRTVNSRKVEFETFLSEIIKTDNVSLINFHHMSYFNRCRPCDVSYDYFGTVETFDSDFAYIVQRLHINVDSIPHTNAKNTPKEKVGSIIGNLPDGLKRAIWERYREDYYIFGYPRPAFTDHIL